MKIFKIVKRNSHKKKYFYLEISIDEKIVENRRKWSLRRKKNPPDSKFKDRSYVHTSKRFFFLF